MGGNKFKAISKTPSKIIINMDIAVEALNKTDIQHLHSIIDKLNVWDDKNKHLFRKKNTAYNEGDDGVDKTITEKKD